jgi:hypothetical protein
MMECYDNHTNVTSSIQTSRNRIMRGKDKIPQLHHTLLTKIVVEKTKFHNLQYAFTPYIRLLVYTNLFITCLSRIYC